MTEPTTALGKLRNQQNASVNDMNIYGDDFLNMQKMTNMQVAEKAAEKANDLKNADKYMFENKKMFEQFNKLPPRSGGRRRKTRTRRMSRRKKQTRSGKKSHDSRKQRR